MTNPPLRHHAFILVALMISYVGLFIAFFPRLAAIEDEVGFINQALVWSKGAISSEGAGYGATLADFQEVGGRRVGSRHPGRSLVALPFLMAFGLPGVFISGMLLHLIMTTIGATLLCRLGRSPLWASLLLFHPTLALYSRTVLADGPAGSCLLLAALATLAYKGRGVLSGIAVGLAALMRAHAGMVLPIVAVSLRYPPRGERPWRDVAGCLLGGMAVGGLNMGYNLMLYGTPIDPFSSRRGFFALDFFVPHALFYSLCLIVIWPAMLLAPLCDRSPLRWLVRGVCGLYFVLFSFYYFHDDSPRFLETIVIGQRLIQVALPLWIISYATVVDDSVLPWILNRLGSRRTHVSIAFGLLTLVAGNGVIFASHQQHLTRLRTERDAIDSVVPANSLIVRHGQFQKLFGIPICSNTYRFETLEYNGQELDPSAAIEAERDPWYLVVIDPFPGMSLPDSARQLIDRHGLTEVPVIPSRVHIYRSQGLPRANL